MYTVKPYDILNVKHALLKPVYTSVSTPRAVFEEFRLKTFNITLSWFLISSLRMGNFKFQLIIFQVTAM
jgi:hypothetical protein